jgi:hypothetical protein
MSQITLNINVKRNTSLQVGDIIYYLGTNGTAIKRIGKLISKTNSVIVCEIDASPVGDISQLSNNSYIFFSKDSIINTSGLLGYYAEINFSNDSTEHAELFAVNSEIFISSN